MPNLAPVLICKIEIYLWSSVMGAATCGLRGVAWAFHVRDGIRGLVMLDEEWSANHEARALHVFNVTHLWAQNLTWQKWWNQSVWSYWRTCQLMAPMNPCLSLGCVRTDWLDGTYIKLWWKGIFTALDIQNCYYKWPVKTQLDQCYFCPLCFPWKLISVPHTYLKRLPFPTTR